jgi:hypothetical protein
MQPLLRGIFLTSDHPAATAAFYREVARLPVEKVGKEPDYVYWKYDSHGMQLAIHDARQFAVYTNPPVTDSNVTHLYFKIASQEQFLAHLESQGITPFSADDVVVTVIDPDGRKVMFGTA